MKSTRLVRVFVGVVSTLLLILGFWLSAEAIVQLLGAVIGSLFYLTLVGGEFFGMVGGILLRLSGGLVVFFLGLGGIIGAVKWVSPE